MLTCEGPQYSAPHLSSPHIWCIRPAVAHLYLQSTPQLNEDRLCSPITRKLCLIFCGIKQLWCPLTWPHSTISPLISNDDPSLYSLFLKIQDPYRRCYLLKLPGNARRYLPCVVCEDINEIRWGTLASPIPSSPLRGRRTGVGCAD